MTNPASTDNVQIVYGCTNPECDERMRGVSDEPSFCSMCLEDLTGIALGRGVEVADILRPYPMVSEDRECDFCRREVPCECAGAGCMCTCGRCMAEPLPAYTGPVDPDWLRGRLG